MTATSQQIEHFDVLIVGAGISGVGGAYHLTTQCPGTSFVVLEAQDYWTEKDAFPAIDLDNSAFKYG